MKEDMNVLEDLYNLLVLLKDKSNKHDYEYLRFLVQHTERDHMGALLKQLEKMREEVE